MAYRYRSRRSIKKLARRSRRNFVVTLIISTLLIYSTVTWILPSFIGSISFIKNIIKPTQKNILKSSENASLAPPVLNIPFEATNTARIDIKGFATPNSKVKLYIDDEPRQTTDVADDGAFNFENITLSLGTNNIYGTTFNTTNKESLSSKTIKLIYDNEKPPLNIFEPEDDKKIQGGDRKVKVAGQTDPGIKVFVNDNQVIVNSNGNFAYDLPLTDGDNTITIKAIDTASNITESQRLVNYIP